MTQNPPNIPNFNFLTLHQNLFISTASERYAGWLGQIYTPENYEGRITRLQSERTSLNYRLLKNLSSGHLKEVKEVILVKKNRFFAALRMTDQQLPGF